MAYKKIPQNHRKAITPRAEYIRLLKKLFWFNCPPISFKQLPLSTYKFTGGSAPTKSYTFVTCRILFCWESFQTDRDQGKTQPSVWVVPWSSLPHGMDTAPRLVYTWIIKEYKPINNRDQLTDAKEAIKKSLSRANRPTCGMGLQGMRDRAELFGGSFHLDSRVGHGTKIHVTWPLVPQRPFQ